MKRPCPDCGRVHESDMARALGRFDGAAGDALTFCARYQDAPLRFTREEAEADMCRHYQRAALEAE